MQFTSKIDQTIKVTNYRHKHEVLFLEDFLQKLCIWGLFGRLI